MEAICLKPEHGVGFNSIQTPTISKKENLTIKIKQTGIIILV